jgi:LytS/YehU family sensor histidine kinase
VNLAPGKYQFQIAAQDEEGAWSAASTLALTIRPPWWVTGWARAVEATILGLLVFGIYRYRTNQIRTENSLTAEIQRLEQSALHAQMNPHFIFNCLNSIQNFILQNEQQQATQYLSNFARLVRDTLNASMNGWVTLEEEIRMLNNYLALEKLRFKEGFDYLVETEEGLDVFDLRLPPLLIQPMVENAILHGMKNTAGQGYIQVYFREEMEQLVATVTDNGSGLSATNDAPKNPAHRSVGMGITQKRLAMLNPKKTDPALQFKAWHHLDGKIGGMQAELRIPINAGPHGAAGLETYA